MGRTAALPFAPHRQQHGAAKTAGHAHIGVFLGANLHQRIAVCNALATRLSPRRCRSCSWPKTQPDSSSQDLSHKESHAVFGQATLWIVP
ncbi:uncharacterized protein TrAtP1_006391 [Trichoderma atroviride]|uniref:Uncharacterized protein n=1 Tax=Hypocrea atroviridis (strain ATCC 20476 / IMI 206040) TaxID=452589 RepID=G9P9I4_HYPAI|nr:uncharacterized protein TRIATDRAFT_322760 [Trichoderma atroviride IMI 206040]EHK40307.1 hypothetical protein TRIATDRAFT_322760 [Trichoderma atroviride IMI 206040]UKZ65196.1 hypothetical protein TrAtP1_006391 [Trichoderma atroviride]